MSRKVGLVVCAALMATPAMALEVSEKVVYAIDYPPIPLLPSLPADYVCVTIRCVSPIPYPSGVALPQGGTTPTVWTTPHSVRFGEPGNPLFEQSDLQVDNPLFESINGMAIGVPQTNFQAPALLSYGGGDQPNPQAPWERGVVQRADWDTNVWASRAVTDRQVPPGAPPEWRAPVAPINWSPLPTGQGALSFDALFGPQFGAAVVVWTADASHGVAGQHAVPGFTLMGQGLSAEPLPYVLFGDGSILGTGQLRVICPCDVDGDPAQTDVSDLLTFLVDWFASDLDADYNGDETVDVTDLLGFLSCWFTATSTGCS